MGGLTATLCGLSGTDQPASVLAVSPIHAGDGTPTSAPDLPCASTDASPANERGKPKLESERGVKRRKVTKNGAFAGDGGACWSANIGI